MPIFSFMITSTLILGCKTDFSALWNGSLKKSDCALCLVLNIHLLCQKWECTILPGYYSLEDEAVKYKILEVAGWITDNQKTICTEVEILFSYFLVGACRRDRDHIETKMRLGVRQTTWRPSFQLWKLHKSKAPFLQCKKTPVQAVLTVVLGDNLE